MNVKHFVFELYLSNQSGPWGICNEHYRHAGIPRQQLLFSCFAKSCKALSSSLFLILDTSVQTENGVAWKRGVSDTHMCVRMVIPGHLFIIDYYP
jgi:hypothetical protein